jgi:hypothetical protein
MRLAHSSRVVFNKWLLMAGELWKVISKRQGAGGFHPESPDGFSETDRKTVLHPSSQTAGARFSRPAR